MGGWSVLSFFRRTKAADSSSTSNTPVFAVNTTELVLTVPELMTARDLNKATRSFSAARLVGRGRNAAVYMATLPSGAVAAAKWLETPPFGSSSTWSASDDAFLRQQVSVLSTLRHDNLGRLLGYAVAPDLRVLVFEFATMGTLHDVLHARADRAGRGGGLQYLHEAAAVSHGGVRSTNVLLFEGLRAKIADYDVLDQLPRDDTGCVINFGTASAYLPPEYLMTGRRIPLKCDVYSFGVVLLEILTGRASWDATMDPHGLVDWATPLLRKGGVEQWIDPKLGTQ
ncbi:PTI1-like tyrosine-protein kinase 1 [Panicum virgatum]|uniref:PTI1-like tyrosine-protein kinase 1 n=1 Tax=Panicum virgatum TaxID=38727 RepID=UPI0019D5038D|nr:PTI1-like tyrosine-protein kinase 1 [Panicum virgatum]